jgi:hypothetical protein
VLRKASILFMHLKDYEKKSLTTFSKLRKKQKGAIHCLPMQFHVAHTGPDTNLLQAQYYHYKVNCTTRTRTYTQPIVVENFKLFVRVFC